MKPSYTIAELKQIMEAARTEEECAEAFAILTDAVIYIMDNAQAQFVFGVDSEWGGCVTVNATKGCFAHMMQCAIDTFPAESEIMHNTTRH
jgi:hypothetical protein